MKRKGKKKKNTLGPARLEAGLAHKACAKPTAIKVIHVCICR